MNSTEMGAEQNAEYLLGQKVYSSFSVASFEKPKWTFWPNRKLHGYTCMYNHT